ncbi:hypothetical protein QYE76_063470 [Lolium multiflorum]|uniref:Uncharacterized protein n=1 Tax=Lolium multiflorum TaxID=4521 RepID=A0AAD8W870_LOLMU|nr:hypothetical protein QYE76_063470 [Lolium multiflorum]
MDQMVIIIIRGILESITSDDGWSGFFNRSMLQESDFCGEELLTWALDPKFGVSLPSSTRAIMALSEVGVFAFHAFRFYSQQWRTWAATYIQAAWRRHLKRKVAELRRKEEEEEGRSSSSKTMILVSRFAAKMDRQRSKRNEEVMVHVPVPKPREPDFGIDD